MMNQHHRQDNRNGPYNRPPPRHMQRGPPQRPIQYNPHEEIPPQHRRTLILSNIPPTLTFREIRDHFTNKGMQCDFCTIDRDVGDAYVKFRERGDVLKLWEGGDGLLDGDGGDGLSLVNAGVKIKAIHFTNIISLKEKGGEFDSQSGGQSRGSQPQLDRNDQQFDRKRSWNGRDDRGGRGPGSGGREPNVGGRGSFMGRERGDPRGDFASKMPRHEYHSTPNQLNYNPQQGSSSSGAYSSAPSHPSRDQHQGSTTSEKPSNSGPASNPSNSNSYEKSPSKLVQIHSQHSPAQTSWRPTLTAQISTLQQKLNLVSQQEATLQKQLGLQKKMLAVLKAKNDDMSKDDQSKQLKDILTTQTKIMELKKEKMDGLKELQGLKSKQKLGIEKKRTAAAKKKLDMRTTMLKIDGLDCEMDASLEESIKDHFTAFGRVTEVTIKCNESDDQSKVLYALVTFANRADAEKAKASESKFNEKPITCAWHKDSTTGGNEASRDDGNLAEADEDEEANDSFNATFDDVYGEDVHLEDGGSDYMDDEEQLVDYD